MAKATATAGATCTLALLVLMLGAAPVPSKAAEQNSSVPTADGKTFKQGIARDPSEVQAQQGAAAKASPGTVGAAPGADTPSQNPKR